MLCYRFAETGDFEVLYGNKVVNDLLTSAIDAERLHHALLFHGPAGVGKFTTAINLIRKLSCRSKENSPCGNCSSCHRLELPFPFYPDMQLFREINTPLYLKRDVISRQFSRENNITDSGIKSDYMQIYEDTLTLLHSAGSLKHYSVCLNANPPIDIIRFSPENQIKSSLTEKLADHPMARWIFNKLYLYQTACCYDRSIKIDAIRDMQKMLYLHTLEGGIKSVILDDADRMLVPAQNSLLKILEEPPGDAVLILVVTNPSGLLPTIRSRCQQIPFTKLSQNNMQSVLKNEFLFPQETIESIVPMCDGSVSRALATDWELENHKREQLTTLFNASDKNAVEWVMEVAHTIRNMNDNEDGLNDLFRWLHDIICSNPDSEILPGALPDNQPFTTDAALYLLDGLVQIRNKALYHIDIQLNLETLLTEVLHQEKRVKP